MFAADYWFQSDPGPLTLRAWGFYIFYAVVFVACLIWSVWRVSRRPITYRPLAWFELAVGVTGLLLVGARLALLPGWSARIWPLLLVGLAVSGPVGSYWARLSANSGDAILKLLTFRVARRAIPPSWQLTLWLLHLIGLFGWVHAAGLAAGNGWAVVIWVGLLGGQGLATFLTTKRGRIPIPNAVPLTPLFLAYASGGLNLLFNLPVFPALFPLYPPLAEVWWLPFYFNSMSVAAGLYALLVELFWLNQRFELGRSRRWRWLLSVQVGLLVLASLAWLTFELFSHRTYGVTGTDSYGYAQVAVDLVNRGSVLHRFDLWTQIADLKIAWAPVISLGYHLPLNSMGDAASVWPLGMSMLLAVGYKLFGETGLYVTGPVMALLAAPLVGWVAVEMAGRVDQSPKTPKALNLLEVIRRNTEKPQRFAEKFLKPSVYLCDFSARLSVPTCQRWFTGSCALFIWVTSIEVIDRSLVPMADVPAALLTTLVWVALLKLRRTGVGADRSNRWWSLTAGVALGLAFDVRYTQVLLVASVVIGLVTLTLGGWRQRGQLLLLAGSGALVAALPDILYRWRVFGSPLANPQTRELTHFAWSHILPTLSAIAQQVFHGQEFGLVAPFLIAGLIWHWRHDRPGCLTLASGALAVIALQLPYQSLRLRDLLPLLPLLAAWTGLGLAWTWRALTIRLIPTRVTMRPRYLLTAGVIFLSLLLPAVRAEPLVTRAWQSHGASFGYVTPVERAALTQLTRLTPSPAAIGVDFNGGAVALHSQRWPFYPGGWTDSEFDCFLARLTGRHIPVFLLDDGPSVRPALERLTAAKRLRPVARLAVPIPAGESASGQLYAILPDQSGEGIACQAFFDK